MQLFQKYSYSLIAIVLLSSCSITKKAISSNQVKLDSSVSKSIDSTNIKNEIEKSTDFQLKDFDITIEYAQHDTIKAQDYFPAPEIQKLHDVVKSVSANRVPEKVTIHIGSIKDTTHFIVKTDSVHVVSKDTTTIHKVVHDYNKNVFKTRIPLAVTIGAIILLILIVVFIIYKLKNKIPFL